MDKICFLKARRDYLSLFREASLKFVGELPKEKYLLRQLRFMGYVPLSTYKIRSGYAYFMTNRMLEGEYYVYPKRFADNYRTLQKGKYPYYMPYMGLYGLPGITKLKGSEK